MNVELEDDGELEAELNEALDAGKPAVEAPVEETAAEEQERLYRREGRRFVAKEEEKPEAVAKEGAQPVNEKPAPKAWKPTWYKEEYGPWDTLAEPFRNALRDQERNAAQAIEKHSTAAKAWEPVNKLIEPHIAELRAAGVEPQQYVTNLINADAYLREQPVEALNWLCQQYLQCDVVALADWMAANGQQPERIDPVKQQLEALQREITTLKNLPQQQQRQAAEQQIQTWSKDKPDFAAVRQTMAFMAKQKPDASLDELYAEAQWAHPEIRERILAEREDKRIAELKGKRQAGAQSPRTGQNGSQAPSHKTMTLEEEIAAILG